MRTGKRDQFWWTVGLLQGWEKIGSYWFASLTTTNHFKVAVNGEY